MLTASFIVLALCPHWNSLTPERYEGEMVIGRRTIDVSIEFDVLGSETQLRMEAPQMHMPLTAVEDLSIEGTRYSGNLPGGRGRLTINRNDDTVEGSLQFPGGSVGVITLARGDYVPIVTEKVTFSSGDVNIEGAIYMPRGEGPFPGLVIVHGSGYSTYENEGYRFWLEYFAKQGYIVLGWSKRGSGNSEGDWRESGFGALAEDAANAANLLSSHSHTQKGGVGAVGFSQGGWVAPLAATMTDRIKHITVVSGTPLSVFEADSFATKNAYRRASSLSESDVEKGLEHFRVLVSAIDDDDLWDEYEKHFEKSSKEPWAIATNLTLTPRDSWFVSWYRRVKDYSSLTTLKQLDVPILWLFGTKDTQVDPNKSIATLLDIRHQGEKEYTIQMFANAGHGLNYSIGEGGTAPWVVAPGVFESMREWLRSHSSPI